MLSKRTAKQRQQLFTLCKAVGVVYRAV